MKEKETKFKTIYNDNFAKIFRFLYSRVGNKEDTEDLLMEVFSVVWQNVDSIDTNQNVSAFIYSIAKNKLMDFLRKKYKLHFVNLDSEFFDVEDKFESSNNLDKLKSLLEKVVESLSEREQVFYKLKYKQNYSYPEIAKELNITEGNAKIINNRFLKKIKELWTNKQI